MKSKGFAFENKAAKYLARRGLTIIERNYNCRTGEIDLIALDGDCLVFVEVKGRSNQRMMSIRETISHSKRNKLIKAARHFIANNPVHAERAMRFDFVGMDVASGTTDWLKDIFDVL